MRPSASGLGILALISSAIFGTSYNKHRHPKPGMELIKERKPAHWHPPFGIQDAFVSSTVTFIKRWEQENKMKQTSVRSSAELRRASCQMRSSSLHLSWNERAKPLTTYWVGPSKGFKLGEGWCFVAFRCLQKGHGVLESGGSEPEWACSHCCGCLYKGCLNRS